MVIVALMKRDLPNAKVGAVDQVAISATSNKPKLELS